MNFARAPIVATIAVVLALPQPTAATADEGWTIERFAADITIRPDASLHVVETIDVNFGGLERHGIFRTIPVRYKVDDTHVRVYRLSVTSVTDATDRVVPYAATDQGGYRVVKIGDANRLVSGRQTYRVTYDLAGALNTFSDRDELFWNVNGPDWPVPTSAVTASVHASQLGQIICYEGAAGSREPCRSTPSSTSAQFATARPLDPGEQLTVVAALPKGTVAEPAPIIERDSDNPLTYFEPQPAFLALAVLVLVGGLAFLFWRWYAAGRDLRERETIVPEYEPPDSLRPAQLGLLLDESADTKDVTATIVDLAVRGYLTITDIPELFGRHDWQLTQKSGDVSKLLPYEKTLLDGLFAGREQVKVSELKGKFRSTLQQTESQVVSDAMARRLFTTNPTFARGGWGCLGIAIVGLGAFATYQLGLYLGWGIVGAAVVLVGMVLIATAKNMSQRSAAGRDLLQKTLGFRLYMNTAEKYRQQFAEKAEIFTQLLPYAIVFGVVNRWAKAFEGIDTSASNGWYVGNQPFQAALLASSLQSMNDNISSAISSAPPSSGSSSGFSGGSSGGGGGGGGGGSW